MVPYLESPRNAEVQEANAAFVPAQPLAARPSYRELAARPAGKAVTERELAGEVSRALAPLTPGTPRERRTIMAEVLVHVVYSMLNFSIRDGQEHSESIIELKRLLAAYLLSAERT